MDVYELSQKFFSWGSTYEVRSRSSATTDVLYTIKGKVLSMTPSLAMFAGAATDGQPTCTMKGNFLKTKFEALDSSGKTLGTLTFPTLTLKQVFTITTAGEDFKADGGFLGGQFTCNDAAGNPVLIIAKELSLTDRYSISTSGRLPLEVALLATVAIQQRFMDASASAALASS
jgi:uncharacterized protein YxjI